MNCKDTLSCTFLDLFLYIVDKKHVNKMFFNSEYQINPNTYLKISRTFSDNFPYLFTGKFLIKFTQTTTSNKRFFYQLLYDEDYDQFKHTLKPYVTVLKPNSCELELLLEYNRDGEAHLSEQSYRSPLIEHNESLKEEDREKIPSLQCDSFKCLYETFKYFIILYNFNKKMNKNVDYNSIRFSIEEGYCLEEQKRIINEIDKIAPTSPPKRSILKPQYRKRTSRR